MGNTNTREPTPEEKMGYSGRYNRPNSRYSSNARYRRYHKVRGSKETRNRHTSSSRSDDERFPDRNQNKSIQKKPTQRHLENR